MGDYERSTTVAAPPGVLFDYLSDVGNLPHYFAAMKTAEPGEGNEVHTVAEVDGHRVEGDAWFTAENDYAGELSVAGDGDGSRVTVKLHSSHGEPEKIESGLEETLAAIKRNVEGNADPAAP
jgi:hypothetical protein